MAYPFATADDDGNCRAPCDVFTTQYWLIDRFINKCGFAFFQSVSPAYVEEHYYIVNDSTFTNHIEASGDNFDACDCPFTDDAHGSYKETYTTRVFEPPGELCNPPVCSDNTGGATKNEQSLNGSGTACVSNEMVALRPVPCSGGIAGSQWVFEIIIDGVPVEITRTVQGQLDPGDTDIVPIRTVYTATERDYTYNATSVAGSGCRPPGIWTASANSTQTESLSNEVLTSELIARCDMATTTHFTASGTGFIPSACFYLPPTKGFVKWQSAVVRITNTICFPIAFTWNEVTGLGPATQQNPDVDPLCDIVGPQTVTAHSTTIAVGGHYDIEINVDSAGLNRVARIANLQAARA